MPKIRQNSLQKAAHHLSGRIKQLERKAANPRALQRLKELQKTQARLNLREQRLNSLRGRLKRGAK